MKKALLFYVTLFLFILVFSMTSRYFDFDLWARLVAGMGVIDGGHVLTSDFLSYSPVHTWWDHEWGAGVIFYWFLKYLGPYSLIFLHACLIFAIFFTASRVIKLRTDKSPYNIIFYLFAAMTALDILGSPVRCHLFSFLFFTIFIYILEKVRRGNDKLLFILPVIILFWNNIHGGVVSGIGLILMYAVGEFLNKKPFKNYLITLFVSCLVLLINPWGFEYIKFLLMANTMERKFIVEWRSIFNTVNPLDMFRFKIFAPIVIFLESLSFYKEIKTLGKDWFFKIDKVKYIVILSTFYLAVSHVKLIPFFIISTLCFIYEDFYKLIENKKFPEWKDKVIYSFILFFAAFTFISRDFSLPVGVHRYPVKEVEFIRQNNINGNLLTNMGSGSYVSYKLYPNNLIFMDGRYEEVYPYYTILLLKQFFLVTEGWDEVLKYFKPDVMIIEKEYPIYEFLQKGKYWKNVYEGNQFAVFVPYEFAKDKKFVQPSNDMNYYKNTLFSTDIKF